MSFQVSCPHCSKTVTVPDLAAGKAGKCPKCKKGFQVGDKPEPDPFVMAAAPIQAPTPQPFAVSPKVSTGPKAKPYHGLQTTSAILRWLGFLAFGLAALSFLASLALLAMAAAAGSPQPPGPGQLAAPSIGFRVVAILPFFGSSLSLAFAGLWFLTVSQCLEAFRDIAVNSFRK